MSAAHDVVMRHLDDIADPCSVAAGNRMSIVELGLIREVVIEGDLARVRMCLTSPTCPMLEYFGREMTQRVVGDAGIARIVIEPDTGMEWTPDRISADATRRRRQHLLTMLPSSPDSSAAPRLDSVHATSGAQA